MRLSKTIVMTTALLVSGITGATACEWEKTVQSQIPPANQQTVQAPVQTPVTATASESTQTAQADAAVPQQEKTN